MADAEQGTAWQQACERQDQVLGLLKQEHRQLTDTLLRLVHPLLAWGLLDGHASSKRGGIGDAHDAVDRKLAAALSCVIDVVADARIPQATEHLVFKAAAHQCLRDVEDEIAAEVEAEQRLGRNLLHILDEVPVDDGIHLRMRASIDKLMDRVQFWREHPGDAYDGEHVADVLMPIITQLLEHRQQEVGR